MYATFFATTLIPFTTSTTWKCDNRPPTPTSMCPFFRITPMLSFPHWKDGSCIIFRWWIPCPRATACHHAWKRSRAGAMLILPITSCSSTSNSSSRGSSCRYEEERKKGGGGTATVVNLRSRIAKWRRDVLFRCVQIFPFHNALAATAEPGSIIICTRMSMVERHSSRL